MKKVIFCGILISGLALTSFSCAFFVGFGSSGGAEQVITKGQEAGVIPKTPGETQYSTSWTKESLTWNGDTKALTSTCTILMPDSITHRMYFTAPGGLWSAVSTDGLFWESQTFTGISDLGATNPSVIRMDDGNYVMIYGIQTNSPTTERLNRAVSNNGITFIKTPGPFRGGAVMVANAGEDSFVSVPDLIHYNTSTLRMYFVASPLISRVHTATSTDSGQTWSREGQISITGGTIGG